MSEPHTFGDNYRDGHSLNGVKALNMNDETGNGDRSSLPGQTVRELETVLSGIQGVFTDVTSSLDRVYHELAQRDINLQRREESLTEREQAAISTMAKAQREATAIAAQAEREKADALEAAETEAARIVERSRGVEQQVAARLAEIGRREQELRDREQQFAETAKQQQSEREWLNQYAQTLSGIAGDLERAVGDLQPAQ
jgi:chromosome segregation ATPase